MTPESRISTVLISALDTVKVSDVIGREINRIHKRTQAQTLQKWISGKSQKASIFLVMQGVIKAYDPSTGDGVVIRDTDLSEYDLAVGALDGSIFRMLRQGQRVVFSLDSAGRATKLRLGSERDMETPGA
ncbi:unannotated protein [freshwater metagenome]|uniref:Unannotated protein n=1 Tax=freshwater metagenome TaxID=449393 RepID=A0A6J7UNH8_9ZZZZ|nr:hypothetical protein [Actinomycetota bacterium]MTA64948.1 hypothetical protein [Actinomycetota bacterium]MTH91335.1 hypothetical protein [Actinomycetota bacterium]